MYFRTNDVWNEACLVTVEAYAFTYFGLYVQVENKLF